MRPTAAVAVSTPTQTRRRRRERPDGRRDEKRAWAWQWELRRPLLGAVDRIMAGRRVAGRLGGTRGWSRRTRIHTHDKAAFLALVPGWPWPACHHHPPRCPRASSSSLLLLLPSPSSVLCLSPPPIAAAHRVAAAAIQSVIATPLPPPPSPLLSPAARPGNGTPRAALPLTSPRPHPHPHPHPHPQPSIHTHTSTSTPPIPPHSRAAHARDLHPFTSRPSPRHMTQPPQLSPRPPFFCRLHPSLPRLPPTQHQHH